MLTKMYLDVELAKYLFPVKIREFLLIMEELAIAQIFNKRIVDTR